MLVDQSLDNLAGMFPGNAEIAAELKRTVLHEALHMLGLTHPQDAGDGVVLAADLDNTAAVDQAAEEATRR